MQVNFYQNDNGSEPVRNWLKSLEKKDRKTIGEDIKTLQHGWPVGMPLVRSLDKNLLEVRSKIRAGCVRVIFTIFEDRIILLHGFIKKRQKTPKRELELSRKRLRKFLIN